ncbi:hypothetical protein [Pseudomonas sp. ZS001]|uniref:hypothetical protein n=1 Tax=Pseudomonas sp. ZS001 TaxID=3138070 RepID=UPI00313971B9
MSDFGYLSGETCHRKGCAGIVKEHAVEDCSCHICSPCGACTSLRGYCEACGWEESEDQVINDYVVSVDKVTGVLRSWEPRPLNPNKIDWRSHPHTSSTMIKEGVFPIGTPPADVEKAVRGTFGGRFERFNEDTGHFKYIAYTD